MQWAIAVFIILLVQTSALVYLILWILRHQETNDALIELLDITTDQKENLSARLAELSVDGGGYGD